MRGISRTLLGLILIVVLVVALIVLLIGLAGGGGKKKHKSAGTVTTIVNTKPSKKITTPPVLAGKAPVVGKAPESVVVPKPAVQEAAKGVTSDAADAGGKVPPKDETPPNVSPAVIEKGREAQDKSALKDLLPVGIPLAAPTVPGCLSRFLRTNFSSRRGVAPKLWVIHWSGGNNLPGWQDVNGLTAFGNNPQAQVSWNFNMDREGHCNYNVNVLNKAWTQAGFNPWAISVEVINNGGPRDRPFLTANGLSALGKVIAYTAHPFHIPLRLGAASGCAPTRSGIVSHRMLGPCGGGHPDIGAISLAPIIDWAQHWNKVLFHSSATAADKVLCRKINWWRKHGRHHGKAEKNAVRRVHALKSRHLRCTSTGKLVKI